MGARRRTDWSKSASSIGNWKWQAVFVYRRGTSLWKILCFPVKQSFDIHGPHGCTKWSTYSCTICCSNNCGWCCFEIEKYSTLENQDEKDGVVDMAVKILQRH